MDFFSAQDDARKKTKWLVLLFVLAVLSLIILTNLFLVAALATSGIENLAVPSPEMNQHPFLDRFSWERFLAVGFGVSVVILGGSLFKSWSIGRGGKSVAEMMGGRLVSPDTPDPDQRKLLNVVEEMAIASGIPVPMVYVMENEPGINAFAAGLTTGDAVVAVTRGTIEQLSRSELQGVVAHEFSHILNGDMRLNMRLIGVLFGILMIGLIGRILLRSSFYSSAGRSSRGKNDSGAALIALGVGLLVLGYAGTFFGNLIKASISRQREYLADASAVQFTRDPDGIAGALKKIGGSSAGSLIRNPDAPELSHAYFSAGIPSFLGGFMATHPPLKDRIRRIQPQWDGKFIAPSAAEPAATRAGAKTETTKKSEQVIAATVLAGVLRSIENTGQPSAENLAQATGMIRELPQAMVDAAHEPYGARALIYALVLETERDIMTRQFRYLNEKADTGVAMQTELLLPSVRQLQPRQRLTIMDMSMPALRQLSDQQYQTFKSNLIALIKLDGKVTPFEWAVQKIVLHHLDADFEQRRPPLGKYGDIRELAPECSVLLSFLARVVSESETLTAKAFDAALTELNVEGVEQLTPQAANIRALDNAFDRLVLLKPLLKPQLLRACAACIVADDKITASEMELLRAFSSLLDCPLPPLPEELLQGGE